MAKKPDPQAVPRCVMHPQNQSVLRELLEYWGPREVALAIAEWCDGEHDSAGSDAPAVAAFNFRMIAATLPVEQGRKWATDGPADPVH